MTLSIIIPAYNEEPTIAALLERVFAVHLPGATKEVIVVNDGSTDGTAEILKTYEGRVRVLTHPKNRGKGAAVRTGFAAAMGEYVVVQDGDLEYDPRDIVRMFALAKEKNLPAVFGSRRLPLPGQKMMRGAWRYYVGGVAITWAANLLYGLRLTDEPTCYKMLRKDVLARLHLTAEGFEFCPEVTAQIARLHVPITEVPISYHPRTEHEGKKIRAKDGVIAIWTLFKNRL